VSHPHPNSTRSPQHEVRFRGGQLDGVVFTASPEVADIATSRQAGQLYVTAAGRLYDRIGGRTLPGTVTRPAAATRPKKRGATS
jgi:hypothetical protein